MSNPNHKPKGPGGGQFAGNHSTTGPGSAGAPVVSMSKEAKDLGYPGFSKGRGLGWAKYRVLIHGPKRK